MLMRGLRVRVGGLGVFTPFLVIAFAVMFSGTAMRFGSIFMMLGGFRMRLFGHFPHHSVC